MRKYTLHRLNRIICLIFIFCCLFLIFLLIQARQKTTASAEFDTEIITSAEEFEKAVKNAANGQTLLVDGEITLLKSVELNKSLTIKKADTAKTAVFKLSEAPLNTGRHFIIGKKYESKIFEVAFVGIGFQGHGGQIYLNGDGIQQGGGITVLYGPKLTLTDCSFWGNRGVSGSAVELIVGASLYADNCQFMYNHSSELGGAVYSVSSPSEAYCNVTITNSVIENNSAFYYGGGICIDNYSEGTIKNCIINNNITTDKTDKYISGGGGIAAGNSKVLISESLISNNNGNNGGGIYFYDTDASVSNCIIYKNNAARNGGGIYSSYKCSLFFYECSIYENSSENGGGASIGEELDFKYETTANFVFCTVVLNNSMRNSGINIIKSFTSVYGTIIAGNTEREISSALEPFQFMMNSLCNEKYSDIFSENLTNGGKIKIKPQGLAHNQISQADIKNWQINLSALLSQDKFSMREMQGEAYDIGAYELVEYKVIFTADGAVYEEKIYTEGETILKPSSPQKKGYSFEDWYTDPQYNDKFDIQLTALKDITLYAKWITNTYTIIYNFQGNNIKNTEVMHIVTYGQNYSLFVPSYAGYTFNGWYSFSSEDIYTDDKGQSLKIWDETTDKVLYASWTANIYTIIYDYQNAANNNNTTSYDVTYGQRYTLAVPVRKGYTFKGWYSALNEGIQYTDSNGLSIKIWDETTEKTLYAKWEKSGVLSGFVIFLIAAGGILVLALCAVSPVFIYQKRIKKLAMGVTAAKIYYPELDVLTPRESEIFKLLIAGNTLRQITGELKISYDTVHFHYKNVYKKLNVNSRVELIKKFSKDG